MARLDIYATDKVIEFFHLLLILQTIQHNTVYGSTVESHNQAFIQTDKHLTYIVGDNYIDSGVPLEIKPGSSFPDLSIQDDNFFSNNIRLDPPMLDFQHQPVGMPRMEKVIVQNNDPKHSLHLSYISGSTQHFHCSFFQDKIVPPGGNTSFDVVFLARQEGNVENTLFIHTSIGSIRYQVFGVGIPNPYRLRPYLGARVPINSSFTPVIQMHNPYSTSLQVLEMFASEGDLHLELPSGDKEGPHDLWELKPFETKALMKTNFVARVESNHSAFIRIKTNREEKNDGIPELVILPFEVEVSSDPGIYSPVELLDFGILRTLDEPKTLRLSLINSGPKAIHITSVNISPPNSALSVDFRPFKLQPDGGRATTVAQITFKARAALQSKQWSGKIVIKTKNNSQRLIIPYQANVLHGSLVYNKNTTQFFSAKALWNVTRPMTFTNTFNFSVVIYNVSLPPEVSSYFSILNFTDPVILEPQQSVAPFLLKFHPNETQIHFNTVLTVSTNASTFSIPIIVYSGLLKVVTHRPEKSEGFLEFGTLGVGETRSMTFTIRNDNPVDIIVAELETNMTWASVELIGIEKGNGTTLTRAHNTSDIKQDPLYIKPYHYAVFNVSIVAPQEEDAYVADIWMFTQFQDLFIPITFRAAKGSLSSIPDKFVFEKVYPGRIPYKVLQINSTFDDYMEVTKVTFQPANSCFYFVPQTSNTVLLKPHEHSIVGNIFFNAKSECKDDCYVGLPTLSPAGHQWLLGMSLDKDVADTDQYLYTKLQQKWERLESLQQNIVNVTIQLDTNQVLGFLFSAQAHLQWPSLIRKSRIKFPLTQIGNLTISDFIVENPGDEPVLVQVLPLCLYPNAHAVIDLMAHRMKMSRWLADDLTEYIETEDCSVFTLSDLGHIAKNSGTTTAKDLAQHRKTVESTLGVSPHKHTLGALLKPGAKIKVKIGFQPKDDLIRSSLIVIRNNLTIIDAVVVQGQGRRGEMKFNDKKPGSHRALTFEMTEKHLKNCDTSDKKANKNIMPNFTVRRPFTLKNSGELPFYIHGFSINDLPCEGYGFKVLDCFGFEMAPNSSRKINIAFTPDFTMSQIQRTLTILTSLGPPASSANYSLQAMVPYDLLSQCSAALPRPSWEPLLYYFVVCLMTFIVCCVLVLAYFEADRVFAEYLRRSWRHHQANSAAQQQTFDKSKVFDLRSVQGLAASGGGGGNSPVSSSPVGQSNTTTAASVKVGAAAGGGAVASYANGKPAMNGHAPRCPPDRIHPQNGLHPNKISAGSLSNIPTPSTTPNGSKNNRTFLGNLIKMVKPLSFMKYFSSSKKNPSSQPQQQEKKETNHSATSSVHRPSTAAASNNNKHSAASDVASGRSIPSSSPNTAAAAAAVLSEKSIPNNSNIPKRDKKGRLNHRRQLVAEPPVTSTTSLVTEAHNSGAGSRKLKENKDPSSTDLTKQKSSTAMLDDFDDFPIRKYNSALESTDDFEDLDVKFDVKSSKRAGTKRNKSKTKLEKERLLYRRESSILDDVDDVSSTTTESSGGDIEDKTSVSNDITPEITTATKKKKNSNKHTERMVVATHGGDLVDDDSNFQVTSKSKAHRNIRVNKETFGGDIMKPSTIELPYCLPTEKEKSEKPRKSKKYSHKGDLSELSLQTENFAHKHNSRSTPGSSGPTSASVSPNINNLSPNSNGSLGSGGVIGSAAFGFNNQDRVSTIGSGRNSSYSSIVSSSSNLNADSLNRGSPSAVGGPSSTAMDGPHPRYSSAGFRSFAENGNVVGSGVKTSSPSAWNPAGEPGRSVSRHLLRRFDFYGLHTEIGRTGFGMGGPGGMEGYNFANPGDVPPQYGYPPQGQQPPQNMTMMQELMMDRRRRFWEYQQQKVNKGEEWPGFSTPSIRNDSLWDKDFNPMEHSSWSTNPESSTSPNGFWSTISDSASSGWSSLQSLANIWGSTQTPDHHPGRTAGPGFNPALGPSQPAQQVSGGSPPFNPFTSMADIWSPNSTSGSLGGGGNSAPGPAAPAPIGLGRNTATGSPSSSPGAPGSRPTSAQWSGAASTGSSAPGSAASSAAGAPGTPPATKEQQWTARQSFSPVRDDYMYFPRVNQFKFNSKTRTQFENSKNRTL